MLPSITSDSPAVVACSAPLCVDLDGTLILSDTLAESFCLLLKTAPHQAFLAPFSLARGRAYFKRKIAEKTHLNPRRLPYNEKVLTLIRQERERGREIVLVTAADQKIAEAVGAEVGLFDAIIGSRDGTNLKGSEKAATLVERYGDKGFDYVGNSSADLPVWQCARGAYVVGSPSLAERARKIAPVIEVFDVAPVSLREWMKMLRVHQWSKNLLLFVPVIAAHQWSDFNRIWTVLLAFFVFCLGASSVYLLNDLLDLAADRAHATKRYRPFASGRIPLHFGFLIAPVLFLSAVALCFLLPWAFGASFGVYYALTLLYSFWLKQIPMVDVFALSSLYGIRILAGGCAAEVMITGWLMLFSMFIFLSLAFAKRFVELDVTSIHEEPSEKQIQGRGYFTSDREVIGLLGAQSGFLSILVLALYVNHPSIAALYRSPQALWLVCPLMAYWMSRIWFLAYRRKLHDDPVFFALKDRQSWLILLIMALAILAAYPR